MKTPKLSKTLLQKGNKIPSKVNPPKNFTTLDTLLKILSKTLGTLCPNFKRWVSMISRRFVDY
jgi:hypothetical protein